MERVSFNLNIIFGFICVLIGLFGFEDNKIPKGNLIAMICGVIGFLSTLAYAIVGLKKVVATKNIIILVIFVCIGG